MLRAYYYCTYGIAVYHSVVLNLFINLSALITQVIMIMTVIIVIIIVIVIIKQLVISIYVMNHFNYSLML